MIADLHHADRQRRGRGDPAGLAAGADRRDPRSSSTSTARCSRSCDTRFDKGYASGLDVAAQESQLAQVDRHAAAAAQAGGAAARSDGGAGRPLPEPGAGRAIRPCRACSLPQDLPVSLPSALVAQRPDVRQAEANLHAASAQIGIADREPPAQYHADRAMPAARRWPSVSCSRPGTGFWRLGADLRRADLPGRHAAAPGARRARPPTCRPPSNIAARC